jgi:hypothetical protein
MSLKQKTLRITTFLATVGVSAALIGAGVSATGAYFSDTKPGAISGTIGSIKVGTGHTQIGFTNMLPGELQTVGDSYQNVGRNASDVWLVFEPNALHTIVNQLGTYGEAQFANNGIETFASQNLNDNTTSCPPGAFDETHAPCAALPLNIKLADNLAPNASGSWSFGFMYASKLLNSSNLDVTPAWNLPYQIVATQHGIAPAGYAA